MKNFLYVLKFLDVTNEDIIHNLKLYEEKKLFSLNKNIFLYFLII